MKQFVRLFFDNVGYTVMSVIEDIVVTFDEYIKLPMERDDNPPIDLKRMGLVAIYLKSVLQLNKIDFTKSDKEDIIAELKK